MAVGFNERERLLRVSQMSFKVLPPFVSGWQRALWNGYFWNHHIARSRRCHVFCRSQTSFR
jgi:hypothetical protein